MVESSVKSISRPVIDRLPVNVDRLDEFACRQLDRVSYGFFWFRPFRSFSVCLEISEACWNFIVCGLG